MDHSPVIDPAVEDRGTAQTGDEGHSECGRDG
jgi:hypothetical protein